jgi:hypothetical protein
MQEALERQRPIGTCDIGPGGDRRGVDEHVVPGEQVNDDPQCRDPPER